MSRGPRRVVHGIVDSFGGFVCRAGEPEAPHVLEMISLIVVGVVVVVSGNCIELDVSHAIVHEPRTHHGISIVRKVEVPERWHKCRAALPLG